MMESEEQRIIRYDYIDLIRAISCILVVLVHVSASDLEKIPYHSYQWSIAEIMNCLGINGVPLFFMISGALALNKNTVCVVKRLIGNKVIKLLLAYFFTCFFYNLVPFVRGWVPVEGYYLKEYLIEGTIYGTGMYHIWFIPTMISVYLLIPILKEAFSNQKTCEYFLVLFLIAGVLIPTIQLFDIPGPINRLLTHVEGYYFIDILTGYIGYFVLGHYLHSYCTFEMNNKRRIIIGLMAGIGILLTYAGCLINTITRGTFSSLFNTPFSINAMISCVSIFLLLRALGTHITNKTINKMVQWISAYSLGIYLFHPFVLNTFGAITNENYIPIYCVSLVVRLAATLIITCIIVYILKKIPYLNRII